MSYHSLVIRSTLCFRNMPHKRSTQGLRSLSSEGNKDSLQEQLGNELPHVYAFSGFYLLVILRLGCDVDVCSSQDIRTHFLQLPI